MLWHCLHLYLGFYFFLESFLLFSLAGAVTFGICLVGRIEKIAIFPCFGVWLGGCKICVFSLFGNKDDQRKSAIYLITTIPLNI
jgi:hypothetical protein